jgi:hypothetical protein
MTERDYPPVVRAAMTLEVAHLADDKAVVFLPAFMLQTN